MGRQLCDVIHPYLCLLGFQHHEGNPCLSIRGHGVPVDLVAHNATVLAADARAESPVGKSPTFVHCKRNQLETIVCHFRYGFRIPCFPRQIPLHVWKQPPPQERSHGSWSYVMMKQMAGGCNWWWVSGSRVSADEIKSEVAKGTMHLRMYISR